jgi:hypothetical protein
MNVTTTVTIDHDAESEAIHRATMQKVAEEVISPAPPYLSKLLFDWSFDLRSAQSIEESWPTRKKLRKELLAIHRLMDRLEAHLQNSATTGFIAVNSGTDFHEVSTDFVRHLNVQRSRVRQALKSPQLVGKSGKLLQGRGKPLLPNTMPPKYVCAAIITEIFDFFYPDKDSRPPQRKVWSAAEEFWESFFKPEGWGNDPLTGWGDYFRAVDDPRYQSLRSEVCRILSIEARFNAQLMEENRDPNASISLA